MTRQPKRFKGCCAMCAAWIRGDGKSRRLPPRDLRRLGGHIRRLGNHDPARQRPGGAP